MRAIRPMGLLLAAMAGVVGAVVLSAWMAPPDPAVQVPAERRSTRRVVARPDREARPEHRPSARPARAEGRLPPEERAELRELTRTDQATALLLEVEDHALAAGWDDETIAAVEVEMEATTQAISGALARVDRGEVRWEDVRSAVRQERLDSAARVEALLGPERFQGLVASVGLERFGGGTPIRGRLDGRRADAGAAR